MTFDKMCFTSTIKILFEKKKKKTQTKHAAFANYLNHAYSVQGESSPPCDGQTVFCTNGPVTRDTFGQPKVMGNKGSTWSGLMWPGSCPLGTKIPL